MRIYATITSLKRAFRKFVLTCSIFVMHFIAETGMKYAKIGCVPFPGIDMFFSACLCAHFTHVMKMQTFLEITLYLTLTLKHSLFECFVLFYLFIHLFIILSIYIYIWCFRPWQNYLTYVEPIDKTSGI